MLQVTIHVLLDKHKNRRIKISQVCGHGHFNLLDVNGKSLNLTLHEYLEQIHIQKNISLNLISGFCSHFSSPEQA